MIKSFDLQCVFLISKRQISKRKEIITPIFNQLHFRREQGEQQVNRGRGTVNGDLEVEQSTEVGGNRM